MKKVVAIAVVGAALGIGFGFVTRPQHRDSSMGKFDAGDLLIQTRAADASDDAGVK